MTAPDTTLVLGDFTFADFEIPERIPYGVTQRLSIHQFVGGKRNIQAMGASPDALEWGGIFTGLEAVSRAQYLKQMAAAGKSQTLTWGSQRYQVLIRAFVPEYLTFYRIPYRISCEVIEDLTLSVSAPSTPSIDDAMADDMNSVTVLSSSVADQTLQQLVAAVSTAVAAVATFKALSKAGANGVLQPLAAAQVYVNALIGSTDVALGQPTDFAGVEPGDPIASVLSLTSTLSNVGTLDSLYQLNGTLGRMAMNVSAVNTVGQSLATAGGNLFAIASSAYGNAEDWTVIASANGMTDPFLGGPQVVTVPPAPSGADGSGGILSP